MTKVQVLMFLEEHREIINIKQLSREIDVPYSTLSAAVNGTRPLSDSLYIKVTHYLIKMKEELCLM